MYQNDETDKNNLNLTYKHEWLVSYILYKNILAKGPYFRLALSSYVLLHK